MGTDALQARARAIIARLETLPTLGPVATRLLAVSASDETSLEEIGHIIESDPALTARILSMTRRADLPLNQPIETVGRAVVLLGLEAVQAAALSTQVFELMHETASEHDRAAGRDEPAIDRDALWTASIAGACAAELLAERSPGVGIQPGSAFVCALLCDIGRLALELALPGSYGNVVRLAESQGVDCATAERQLIGMDHHTAGRRLARHWGLPDTIADVIWLHANPPGDRVDSGSNHAIRLTALARALTRRWKLGWVPDFAPEPEVGPVADAAGISEELALSILPELLPRLTGRLAALGLGEPTDRELLIASVANANARLGAMHRTMARRSARDRAARGVLDAVGGLLKEPPTDPALAFARAGAAASAHWSTGSPGFLEHDTARGLAMRWTPAADGVYTPSTTHAQQDLNLAIAARHGPTSSVLPILEPSYDGMPGVALLGDRGNAAGEDVLISAMATVIRNAQRARAIERAQESGEERVRDQASNANQRAEAQSVQRLIEMTAGAAHELNTPLAIIHGRAQQLIRALRQEGPRSHARAILEASDTLASVFGDLGAVCFPPEPSPVPTTPQDLLLDAITAARAKAGTGATVQLSLQEDLGVIEVDRASASAAIAEALANAITASGSGNVRVGVQLEPGESRLSVRIADDGPGLSPDAQRHATDPFFSEREAGRGTGLGLAKARSLLERVGGSLTLANGRGGGCVATVRLPARMSGARIGSGGLAA